MIHNDIFSTATALVTHLAPARSGAVLDDKSGLKATLSHNENPRLSRNKTLAIVVAFSTIGIFGECRRLAD